MRYEVFHLHVINLLALPCHFLKIKKGEQDDNYASQ